MWLHGSAGAGKSAVAQTMAMEFRAGENLAASFFFSRTAPPDSHRGHEGRFVTTIACQLTEVVPGLDRYVEQVILSRPLVFDLSLYAAPGDECSYKICIPLLITFAW
ncbi:hypothetical protein BJ165DRAFT_1483118 [Panaeolus papilionaceus]|nr:hypothetical protein BJ165DRAFT_1483118 [Panaeolus papilionaceus]